MASATAKAARQLQKRNMILSQKTTFRRAKLLDLMKMEPDRIRTIRHRLQLTQEDFAHLIGVTFSTVNRWENGKSAPNRIAIRLLQGLEKKAKAQ